MSSTKHRKNFTKCSDIYSAGIRDQGLLNLQWINDLMDRTPMEWIQWTLQIIYKPQAKSTGMRATRFICLRLLKMLFYAGFGIARRYFLLEIAKDHTAFVSGLPIPFCQHSEIFADIFFSWSRLYPYLCSPRWCSPAEPASSTTPLHPLHNATTVLELPFAIAISCGHIDQSPSAEQVYDEADEEESRASMAISTLLSKHYRRVPSPSALVA